MNDHSILASGIYGQVRFKLSLFFVLVRSAENVVLGPMGSGPWIPDDISLFQTVFGAKFRKVSKLKRKDFSNAITIYILLA